MRVGTVLPVTPIPNSVAIGDFTNDGKPDLAIASVGFPGFSILVGDGSGQFALGTTLLDLTFGFLVATADFDEDGSLDLAVWTLDGLLIFLGDGAGGFAPGLPTPTVPDAGFSLGLTVADLNGDGHADLVLVDGQLGGGRVTALLGDGTGAFASGFGGGGAAFPRGTTVADFNQDGFPDVAITGLGGVTILLGDGIGGFAQSGVFPAGAAGSIAAADFNGDHAPDLAVISQNPDGLLILLNDGHGGFGAPASLPTGPQPLRLTVGDFTGDAKNDVVLAASGSADLSVYRGDGQGGFVLAPIRFALEHDTKFLAAADLDGDQNLDLVAGQEITVGILLGNGDAEFDGEPIYPVGGQPQDLTVADVNSDGVPDLIVTNPDLQAVSVLRGDGAGRFGTANSYPAGPSPYAVAAADLNGDGRPDLAVTNVSDHSISILLNDGVGGFGAPTAFQVGDGPLSVAVADLDGDGKMDLAVADGTGGDVAILLGNGAGGFVSSSSIHLGGYLPQVIVGDFNGDHHPDLGVCLFDSGYVAVLLNDGSGHFASSFYLAGSNPYSLAAGDLNEDGFPDLAVVSAYGGAVAVLLADGAGGFGPPTPYTVGDFPTAVAIGDLTGDGHLDWVVVNSTYSFAGILAGDGTGSFSFGGSFSVGGGPLAVSLADLNGDGRLDIAASAYRSLGVSVLLNETFTVLPASLPVAALFGPYTASLSQLGGAAPVGFALTGALPAGLSFDAATATISGAPSQMGDFPITVTATDVHGCTTTRAYRLTVGGIQTLIVVTVSPGRAVFPQPLTLTATVTSNPPGTTPTGEVVFTVDGVARPPVPLVDGVATLVLNDLSVGSHTISAVYNGDTTHAASSATAITEIVLATAVPGLTLTGVVVLAVLLAGIGLRLSRG